eukprot:Gb_21948 [translate_table: standard]
MANMGEIAPNYIVVLIACCLTFLAVSGNQVMASNVSWIVIGNVSHNSAIPLCSNLCLMVLKESVTGMSGGDEQYSNFGSHNLPVGVSPCLGKTYDELWYYEPQSMAIVNNGSDRCLDASDPLQLHLAECSGNDTQMWEIVEQDKRITSIRRANNSTEQRFYVHKGRPYAQNSYGLSVENNKTEFFTWVNYTDPIHVLPALGSGLINTSIVKNGGFEDCGIDPGKGFIALDETMPIPLCNWHVVRGKVEYGGGSLWKAGEGNRALHLNNGTSGSIAQVLNLQSGSNYSLTFLLASGNPHHSCGNMNRTLQLLISYNSSISLIQDLWIDVSETEPSMMSWKRTPPLEFTALEQHINLTFSSTTTGSCGPIIDDIKLEEINRPTMPFDEQALISQIKPSSVNKGNRCREIIWVSLVIGLFMVIASALLIYWRLWMRKNSRCRTAVAMSPVNDDICLKTRPWDTHVDLSLTVDQSIQKLSWEEIEKITDNFRSVIGEGGFSTVYLAVLADQSLGAVKVQRRSERLWAAFKQELEVLLRARHVNVVTLIGYCDERGMNKKPKTAQNRNLNLSKSSQTLKLMYTQIRYCLTVMKTALVAEEGVLVFGFVPNGTLHDKLHSETEEVALPWSRRMAIAFQIADALHYLHEVCNPPIVHSDIKSPNVLLDEKYNARLCDFGFSKSTDCILSCGYRSTNSMGSVMGSPGYIDPQYLKTGIVSDKNDVYSFGVLLLELVTGMEAFCVDRGELLTVYAAPYLKDKDKLSEIVDSRLGGQFDFKELEAMATITALCIHEQPNLRPSMDGILSIMHEKLSNTCFGDS